MKTSFYYYKKMVFENTKNTKNKNTLPSPNNFFVFFVFKNKKQFLKTATKQALMFSLFSIILAFAPSSKFYGDYFKNVSYELKFWEEI